MYKYKKSSVDKKIRKVTNNYANDGIQLFMTKVIGIFSKYKYHCFAKGQSISYTNILYLFVYFVYVDLCSNSSRRF